MIKAFKTLIRKFVNILINLKRSPLLTIRYIIKYLFVRYLYRTLTWLILTVIFGNSLFERDFLESITNVLLGFWNSVKNLGWNITVFIDYHIRSFLSWITNKDYSNPQKSKSIIPWFNNTPNSTVPKSPNTGGTAAAYATTDYESYRRRQEEEWYKRMREENPTSRNPWLHMKFPENSNDWLWLGIGGLAVGALGFGVYSYWDIIGPYISIIPHPHSLNDALTSIKNFGTSTYLLGYSAVEALWRATPWSNNMPREDLEQLNRNLDDFRERLRRLDEEEEIRANNARWAATSSDSSTPVGTSAALPSHVIRDVNPFDAGTPSTEGGFRPKLSLNTNTTARPEVLSSVLSSNPDPWGQTQGTVDDDITPKSSAKSGWGSHNPWKNMGPLSSGPFSSSSIEGSETNVPGAPSNSNLETPAPPKTQQGAPSGLTQTTAGPSGQPSGPSGSGLTAGPSGGGVHHSGSAPSGTSAPGTSLDGVIGNIKSASYSDKVVYPSFRTIAVTKEDGTVIDVLQDKTSGVLLARDNSGQFASIRDVGAEDDILKFIKK